MRKIKEYFVKKFVPTDFAYEVVDSVFMPTANENKRSKSYDEDGKLHPLRFHLIEYLLGVRVILEWNIKSFFIRTFFKTFNY